MNNAQPLGKPDFGTRLRAAMDEFGPLCVGIDPHPSLLADWGLTDDAAGLREFSFTVLDALGGKVAALKPQSAFFERCGSAGIAVLEDIIKYSRELNTLCIVDAKRGDIGSTMAGYAEAYLQEGSLLAADAVTISPFLGFGSLEPVIDMAIANGRGIFALCLTSNPEGASVQHAINPSTGVTVASEIAAAAGKINRDYLLSVEKQRSIASEPGEAGSSSQVWQRESQVGPFTIRPKRSERWNLDMRPDGFETAQTGLFNRRASSGPTLGPIGLVVGATIGNAAVETETDLVGLNGPILAPGVGAQGGGPDELRQVFGAARQNVLASSSREILNAGPYEADLRAAALKSASQTAQALRA